jgi:hypothetical protein
MNYPSLYGATYIETANSFSVDIKFVLNDFLLALMIGTRTIYLLRIILLSTTFTDPRSQRMCSIYGCDADPMFAIKCLMK